jgi:hypothetical protein
MSGSLYPVRRSVSQIVRRYTPGSFVYVEDQDIVGEVVRVDGRPDNQVDLGRLAQNVQRYLKSWSDHGGTLVGYYDVDNLRPSDLDVRRPSQVYWEPFSNWYHCVNPNCGVVVDMRSVGQGFDGRCAECRSGLTQFPYIFYHRCGSMQPLRPSRQDACPVHQFRHLYFRDTRSLPSSQWKCRECDHTSAPFYPVCSNASCRASAKAQGNTHIRYSISHWREPWSYFTHKVDYVNLDEGRAREFTETERGRSLLFDAVVGQRPAGRERLYQALMTAGAACPSCGAGLPEDAAFCYRCGKPVPMTARQQIDPEVASLPITPYDGRVAYPLLRDLTESASLSSAVTEVDATTSQRTGNKELRDRGISDVIMVKAFPLTTASFGFTRERPGSDAWLNAFARPESDHRIPVFTNTTKTEGWLVQLRGDVVVEWLRANSISPSVGDLPNGANDEEAKDWLIKRIVGGDETIARVVDGLVHTYSHAMLKSVALVCGLDASSMGELVWTDALAFAVYAGETELGALSATFEQALDQIPPLLDEYAACVFDPTCSIDDHGACVGCLHMTRGCVRFNRDLSRAYLVGGSADDILGDNAVGFFSLTRGRVPA